MAHDYGIYGEDAPKIYIPSTSTTINLGNTVIQKDEPTWRYLINQSRKNGHRTTVRLGAHWEIEFIYYVYKAGTRTQQNAAATALQNLLWNKTPFHYYQHSDGYAFKNASNAAVEFRMVEFKPFSLESQEYRDAVLFKIISTDYVKPAPWRTY